MNTPAATPSAPAANPATLDQLRAANAASAFNQWCGIAIDKAEGGAAEISMRWRDEGGQYRGFLHAGVVGALIDSACGFAAATVAGPVLTAHYAVNCLRPAVGERFIARARVVRAGKQQIFTSCELYAVAHGAEKLVATGDALLAPA